MKKVFIIFFVFLFVTFIGFTQSNEKFNGWKKADTQHFSFIYENSSKETVESYALIADEAWNKIAKIYSTPKDHIEVYVTDKTNTVNAFTYFVPLEIVMFTTPVSSSTFGFRTDWKETFFTHELIHAANISFEGKSRIPEIIFSPMIKNLDLMNVNGWALEGLTTVLETELSAGGRGRSPYFELEFKAPAIENSLITYNDIGLQREPPQGQIYVMGYLIMRSIADRWGIEALADIERNRGLFQSWEESVYHVTGCTAEEIYRDAKIALSKKYAKERTIPEGITISPRTTNTNYFKPAIVLDDGSIITIRTNSSDYAAVVKLDPAQKKGSNYLAYTKPSEDMNTVFEETVLIEGSFNDANSVTADEKGNVYVAMGVEKHHIRPGITLELPLYKWSEEKGLKQLTTKGSYCQPSVSRDGSKLVAVTQKGLKFCLVQIDTDTGAETILLEDKKLDFIQPALNDDGSKVAFLALDGTRGRVCTMDLENNTNNQYKVVYNDDDFITDPSEPVWNGNKLCFTDNSRGRLESFEIDESGNAVPVVSDPAGVLWAYKNEKGIYYASASGTGYVIKMKPSEEWGQVPDFNGPSMPGEIMTFGDRETDYPEFKPYTRLSQVETTEESLKEKRVNSKDGEKPISVDGKVVKHRDEKFIKALDELPPVQTQLSDEKRYFPVPKSIFYMPLVGFIETEEKTHFGLGAVSLFTTPKLQLTQGIINVDAIYYPTMNNFSGDLGFYVPAGNGTFMLFADRLLTNKSKSTIRELNSLDVGYKLPVYYVDDLRKRVVVNLLFDLKVAASFESKEAYRAFSNTSYEHTFSAFTGFELITDKLINEMKYTIYRDFIAIWLYDYSYKKNFGGIESETNFTALNTKTNLAVDFDAKFRYADFPVKYNVPNSILKFNGEYLDSSYPGRGVLQIGAIYNNLMQSGMSFRMYEEAMLSFSNNTVDYDTPKSDYLFNFTLCRNLVTGFELGFMSPELRLVMGYSFLADTEKKTFTPGNFYFNMKIDLFRN